MYKIINFEYALWSILLSILIISSISCNEIPEDCNRFDDWVIISEEEKCEVFLHQDIYLYKNEFYSVCECCSCDKEWNAFDCNGDPLCKPGEDCRTLDFFENAEYLYSAVEN